MRRATLACASLLLLAGLTTACGGDDSSDDGKEDETTSATPTDTSSASESTSESPSDDTSESPSTSESPTTGESTGTGGDNAAFCDAVEEANGATTIDDLRPAVDKLVDNLPDSASDEAEDGLEFLQEELADAKDMDDFTKRVQGGDKEDMANTQEYGKFESTTCTGSGEDSPSVSPS